MREPSGRRILLGFISTLVKKKKTQKKNSSSRVYVPRVVKSRLARSPDLRYSRTEIVASLWSLWLQLKLIDTVRPRVQVRIPPVARRGEAKVLIMVMKGSRGGGEDRREKTEATTFGQV